MIVYKTTNLINGKIYVGQDSNNNPNYLGSGTLLVRSIKKYGKENFEKEVLEECITSDELNEREIYWISELKSRDKEIGYNIKIGGVGQTIESKEKIKNTLKGREFSESTRKKLSDASKGRRHTQETKDKISKLKTGCKYPNRKKSGPLSKECKEKLSESNAGENNSMFGKSIYDVWLSKYGEVIAKEKLKTWKKNKSIGAKNSDKIGKNQSNRTHKKYWTDLGYSEDESKSIINKLYKRHWTKFGFDDIESVQKVLEHKRKYNLI